MQEIVFISALIDNSTYSLNNALIRKVIQLVNINSTFFL